MPPLTEADAVRVHMSEKRGTSRPVYPRGFWQLVTEPRLPLWRRILRRVFN